MITSFIASLLIAQAAKPPQITVKQAYESGMLLGTTICKAKAKGLKDKQIADYVEKTLNDKEERISSEVSRIGMEFGYDHRIYTTYRDAGIEAMRKCKK